jgi:hypothetical protein
MRNTLMAWSVVAIGCGGSSGSQSDMAAPPPDLSVPSLSDKQLCDNACATMIGCGIQYDNTCSGNCQTKAPVFLACIRTAGNDCNALTLCAYQQFSVASCGGGSAGVPQGTSTCNDLRICNANCIDTHAGLPCYCSCLAALSPSLAVNSLIDSQCSNVHCSAPCMVSAASCGSCQMQYCVAQSAQCANN